MSAHPEDPAPRLRYTDPDTHRMEKPPKSSLVELALIGLAYLFALVAPSLVVPPGQERATAARVAVAAGLTLLGVAVALVVAGIAFRRTRNFSWLVVGVVPSFALVAGAAILAGTKAFGS